MHLFQYFTFSSCDVSLRVNILTVLDTGTDFDYMNGQLIGYFFVDVIQCKISS